MLNLFKTNKKEVKEVVVEVATKEYPKIVQEIHDEFFTAGDNILMEANAVLEECKRKDIDKGKRLLSLGFKKVPQAVQAVEIESQLIKSKEIAELVLYYKVNYPNNKFITEEQVKSICEKYGLVCGDVSMYKGFVPEKNVRDIERFKVKNKDIPFAQLFNSDGDVVEVLNRSDFIGEEDGFFMQKMIYSNEGFFTSNSNGVCYLGYNTTEKYGSASRVRPYDKTLKICAPLKDMEIPKSKELKGYKIQDIPDPVVLQPVKGGYLIVTAWGDEASDPIVVNETMN